MYFSLGLKNWFRCKKAMEFFSFFEDAFKFQCVGFEYQPWGWYTIFEEGEVQHITIDYFQT